MRLWRARHNRKNWLFAGHDDAGRSHATLYSLIASAERHGLDPQKYLTSVLVKIGQTKLSEVDQFLPDRWKREEEVDRADPGGNNASHGKVHSTQPARP